MQAHYALQAPQGKKRRRAGVNAPLFSAAHCARSSSTCVWKSCSNNRCGRETTEWPTRTAQKNQSAPRACVSQPTSAPPWEHDWTTLQPEGVFPNDLDLETRRQLLALNIEGWSAPYYSWARRPTRWSCWHPPCNNAQCTCACFRLCHFLLVLLVALVQVRFFCLPYVVQRQCGRQLLAHQTPKR